MTDLMKAVFIELCARHGIRCERHDDITGLDFYLPDLLCFVEVKQFHSPRIAEQMSRQQDVIAIQGAGALNALIRMVSGTAHGR